MAGLHSFNGVTVRILVFCSSPILGNLSSISIAELPRIICNVNLYMCFSESSRSLLGTLIPCQEDTLPNLTNPWKVA